ncbi:unnamed protein product [Meganyctiphanes norvegica]|uniref:Sodium-coupled monocarboxylate transporter 1 n=1 Tax=Meganyctiphanes norvegica TaxID=48144 RepID=A0AAV2QPJ0_MEGNR
MTTTMSATSIEDIKALFTWVDYLVFVIMLLMSAAIGIFFGCFGKKQDASEFLMAGKSMGTFPVAMSLIASFMSAITLLGMPAEVYTNGFSYWLVSLSYFIVMPATAYLYLPVFHALDVTSAYEYLEVRFNSYVRKLGSATFILQMTLYMAIVVYAPALALSQVTGMNVYLSVCLICFICIFYTTVGGMKAVLWTDALQVGIMYAAMIFVIMKGVYDLGGFSAVFERSIAGDRLEIVNWDPNPATRHTFWTLIIGGYFTWIAIYGVNQAQVQRYLSVKELYMARRALWINMIGLFFLIIICTFAGLVIYAKYWDCDPVKSGLINKNDQLFPLFVMQTLGHWPGLPGFFVAGVFSGALSTISSGMNSLAAIVLEDFVKGGCWPTISAAAETHASRALSLFFGVLTFVLVFVAEQLGGILSAALSIFGMVGGPLLGVFSLGMFFPWANSKGAFVGMITGLVLTFWIGVGAQVSKAYGQMPSVAKPINIDGCGFNNITSNTAYETIDATETAEPDFDYGEPLGIYKLSYMWYSATGCFTVIIVGMIVSAITGLKDVRNVNPQTLSPGFLLFKNFIPGLNNLGENVKSEHQELDLKGKELPSGLSNPAFDISVIGDNPQPYINQKSEHTKV